MGAFDNPLKNLLLCADFALGPTVHIVATSAKDTILCPLRLPVAALTRRPISKAMQTVQMFHHSRCRRRQPIAATAIPCLLLRHPRLRGPTPKKKTVRV